MRMTPEPTDKLDTTTTVVNGPEDRILDWQAIDWRAVEDDVRRLRQRIFTASQAGDLKRVRNLQKLMLRSRANTLLSVRRVTEINAGRTTPGVDGRTALLPQSKAELARWARYRSSSWKPRPVKRVLIPKANGRQRPLGIPVIADRVLQARVVNALEPEWEARFEPKSYGFRHDEEELPAAVPGLESENLSTSGYAAAACCWSSFSVITPLLTVVEGGRCRCSVACTDHAYR